MDWKKEWVGMPEIGNKNLRAKRTITVNFKTDEDVIEFGKLLGMDLKPQTKYLWYPPIERVKSSHLKFVKE